MNVNGLTQEDVERQETELTWPGAFGADEALNLGCRVAHMAGEYDRGFTVRIFREPDGLMLFGWAMDDKAPRNDEFVAWKRKLAQECGHASLWAGLTPDGVGIGAGGAFPIRGADDQWIATICVSGLHDGKDHEIAVRALEQAIRANR